MDKDAIRERVWNRLEDSGEARFPFPPHGRIPNFAGSEVAAERLSDLVEWDAPTTVKANPDAPQRPVRRRALEAGKTVYVAVPRLRDPDCFLELDPGRIDDVDRATTISGSAELGRQVGPGDMAPVDLVVAGSVAVDERGARIGKGDGYSDLEFAILREFGFVDDDTTTATTVHELQVVGEELSEDRHDVPVDLVVTPERVIRTPSRSKPEGIDWDALPEDRPEEVPVLNRLRG